MASLSGRIASWARKGSRSTLCHQVRPLRRPRPHLWTPGRFTRPSPCDGTESATPSRAEPYRENRRRRGSGTAPPPWFKRAPPAWSVKFLNCRVCRSWRSPTVRKHHTPCLLHFRGVIRQCEHVPARALSFLARKMCNLATNWVNPQGFILGTGVGLDPNVRAVYILDAARIF